jgi:hypothetical protein
MVLCIDSLRETKCNHKNRLCDGVLLGKLKIPSLEDTCLETIHLKREYMAKSMKQMPNTATKSLTEGEATSGFQNSLLITKQEHTLCSTGTYKEQMGEELYICTE